MKSSLPRIVSSLTAAGLVLLAFCAPRSRAADVDLGQFQPPLREVWNQPRSVVDKARVELGRALYFDPRLSRDNTISCNSCHDLKKHGVDGVAFSLGFGKHPVGRNSPTVLNAFGHLTQFWDGRAPTVEEQAKGPILAAGEMAMPSPAEVVKKLKGVAGYRPLFEAAFPGEKDPVNYDNVGTAIGAFERLLVTPARWDLYLQGHSPALTASEQAGAEKFVQYGCTTCHTGTLLGGDRYMKAGLVKPWPNVKDTGRFALTGEEADKFVFKVPSLRNITKTGPYFHDASATSLTDAIRTMGRHQLGMEIPAADVELIAAFLGSLTGELPTVLTQTPELPR